MVKSLALLSVFVLCTILPAADDDAADNDFDWVQRSNTLARPALEVLAKYNPEAAGRYGLDGYDEAILDLRENVYERNRDDTLRVIEQMKEQLASETHPKVKQDLDLLIQTLSDRLERNARGHRLMLPYVNVAEIAFESTRALLDSNVDKMRHPAAVVRLKKYAGMTADEKPITELAMDRISGRFVVDGLQGPYRGKVDKDIANAQRYLKGIAALMKKHEMQGWEDAHAAFTEQIESYSEWLKVKILPRSRDDHRLPPELYVDRLQTFGVRMSPIDLIERAQFGYMEIRNEMEAIAKRIAVERNWDQDGYRHVIAQLKKEQLATDDILPVYEQRLKDLEEIIRREKIVTLPKRECRIRFASAAESAQIPAPSMQAPRLIGNTGEYGSFLIPLVNPNAITDEKMDDFLHDSISWSLTAHEARPGHEMQFSAVVENGVSIPRAVFAWNSANVEGWGLYAEAIMKEHLPLEGQFFTLHMRLLRAARAFLDPMLNLGKLKPHQAKAFLMRELVLSEPMAAQEVDRYTSWMPGQATSYYYGLMKLQALRTQTEVLLGERFDQLAFHDFVLAQGLLPPELLRKAVLEEFVPAERNRSNSAESVTNGSSVAEQLDAIVVDLNSTKQVLTKHIQQTLDDTGIPSISIALMKDGKIVWTKAFGHSNVTLKVPASPDTIYGVASCFKPVTAMAVMQLMDKGLVKLDDPVNMHLGKHAIADMSEEGKPVTIRHLLSHYSGLTVSTELVPMWARKLPKSLEEHVAELKAKRAPGLEYEYSNSGYTLAGLLIQEVTGQTYEQYVVDHILKPVGSTTTGPVDPTPEMLERLAHPYKLVNRKAVPEVRYRLDVYPAGDIHISVPDLSKVLLAHINGGKSGNVRLLSESSIEEMQTRQFEGKDGLDFGIVEADGDKFIMHGGGIPGYSSKFLLATKARVGVCVVANAGDAQLSNDITARLAIDLMRGREVGAGLIQKVVHVGISFREDEKTGLLRIGNVFPNSSASKAGLSIGTLIRKIGDTDVKGRPLKECLQLMKGPEGTTLTFELSGLENDATNTVELRKQAFLAPAQ